MQVILKKKNNKDKNDNDLKFIFQRHKRVQIGTAYADSNISLRTTSLVSFLFSNEIYIIHLEYSNLTYIFTDEQWRTAALNFEFVHQMKTLCFHNKC